MKICVGMPVYNAEKYIEAAIQSVLDQHDKNFCIVIVDDGSTDHTVRVVKSLRHHQIKLYHHPNHLGYAANLQFMQQHLEGDLLFLLAADDLVLPGAFANIRQIFSIHRDVGVAVRPYYWVHEGSKKPVRYVGPLDKTKDVIVDLQKANKQQVRKLIESVGQVSGLVYRLKKWDKDFHHDLFVSHVFPFLSIAKKSKIVFMHKYSIVVQIDSSLTRNSAAYISSPLQSWLNSLAEVFKEKKWQRVKQNAVEFIASQGVGLLQIRRYGNWNQFSYEIKLYVKTRPLNVVNPEFLFYAAICVLLPSRLLGAIIDCVKAVLLSRYIERVTKI